MQQGSGSTTDTTGAASASSTALTDEQILGLEPMDAASSGDAVAQVFPSRQSRDGGPEAFAGDGDENQKPRVPPTQSVGEDSSYNNTQNGGNAAVEPAWLKALDAQPEAAAEARRWRQSALDTAALDADYFSAEPGARAGLAARLHESDPGVFRAMLADAARILAERDPQGLAELARELGANNVSAKSLAQAARGYQRASSSDRSTTPQRDSSGLNGGPQNDNVNAGAQAGAFPAEAYRAFEAATNDDVARQVRDSIDRSLAATLPDGIADGARRRIGEDIFRDLNATLSTDRELSGKISELLRGWRFDAATRQQLAGLVSGRARKALPEVARRVVSEWTSSVLASNRATNARIESVASRRDITGGRLPEPVASSALRPRQFDYARTSDEQILEM